MLRPHLYSWTAITPEHCSSSTTGGQLQVAQNFITCISLYSNVHHKYLYLHFTSYRSLTASGKYSTHMHMQCSIAIYSALMCFLCFYKNCFMTESQFFCTRCKYVRQLWRCRQPNINKEEIRWKNPINWIQTTFFFYTWLFLSEVREWREILHLPLWSRVKDSKPREQGSERAQQGKSFLLKSSPEPYHSPIQPQPHSDSGPLLGQV